MPARWAMPAGEQRHWQIPVRQADLGGPIRVAWWSTPVPGPVTTWRPCWTGCPTLWASRSTRRRTRCAARSVPTHGSPRYAPTCGGSYRWSTARRTWCSTCSRRATVPSFAAYSRLTVCCSPSRRPGGISPNWWTGSACCPSTRRRTAGSPSRSANGSHSRTPPSTRSPCAWTTRRSAAWSAWVRAPGTRTRPRSPPGSPPSRTRCPSPPPAASPTGARANGRGPLGSACDQRVRGRGSGGRSGSTGPSGATGPRRPRHWTSTRTEWLADCGPASNAGIREARWAGSGDVRWAGAATRWARSGGVDGGLQGGDGVVDLVSVDVHGRGAADPPLVRLRGDVRDPVLVPVAFDRAGERVRGDAHRTADLDQPRVGEARAVLRRLCRVERLGVRDQLALVGGGSRGRARAGGVPGAGVVVEDVQRVVDNLDPALLEIAVEYGGGLLLVLAADRAHEVDVQIDDHGALSDAEAGALGSRGGMRCLHVFGLLGGVHPIADHAGDQQRRGNHRGRDQSASPQARGLLPQLHLAGQPGTAAVSVLIASPVDRKPGVRPRREERGTSQQTQVACDLTEVAGRLSGRERAAAAEAAAVDPQPPRPGGGHRHDEDRQQRAGSDRGGPLSQPDQQQQAEHDLGERQRGAHHLARPVGDQLVRVHRPHRGWEIGDFAGPAYSQTPASSNRPASASHKTNPLWVRTVTTH